jgi:hypothetical protein
MMKRTLLKSKNLGVRMHLFREEYWLKESREN